MKNIAVHAHIKGQGLFKGTSLRPIESGRLAPLKGQCHEIFDFWFFHESVTPKPLSIPLGPFRFFFENSRRYSQLKVHHRCR